jgi:hypothetical protein
VTDAAGITQVCPWVCPTLVNRYQYPSTGINERAADRQEKSPISAYFRIGRGS